MHFEVMRISLYRSGNSYPLLSTLTALIDRFFTARYEVWGKVMFFTRMCHSVHREVGSALRGSASGVETLHLGGVYLHEGSASMGVCLQRVCIQGVILREVCIHLGSTSRWLCIQGCLIKVGLHQGDVEQTPGSAYRRGVCIWRGLGRPTKYMRYCRIRSTNGRYASYWNAFLFFNHKINENLLDSATTISRLGPFDEFILPKVIKGRQVKQSRKQLYYVNFSLYNN